ncbi:MAG: hypothetical protein C4321_09835 [Chloroflexota bacterium]
MTPADEGVHAPGTEALWGESWYFDFAAPDGSVGGYVRLGLYPNLGVAWWWACVVGEGRRPVLVRDHEVALPKPGSLEVRAEGLWGELICETPHEHWSVGMEARGVALDDPADAYRGERGEPVAVGLDLEWEAAGPVYAYSLTSRYEQACDVHGEVLVGDERIVFAGPGERDHSWGVRDWWVFPWVWTAGALNDGTRFHAAGTDSLWHAGFVLTPQGVLEEVGQFRVETRTGAEELPRGARMELDGLALDVTAVAHGPLLLEAADGRRSRFPRALCRFTASDGRAGVGWTEWNRPVSVAGA